MLRVRLALVLNVAALLMLPNAAGAATKTRTVYGTVVAPASASPAGTALPVLLSASSQRRVGRPVIAMIVPGGAKPIHWGTDHLALQELRPGDFLKVSLRGTRASSATLRRSGKADSFDRIVSQFAALDTAGQKTSTLAGPIAQLTTSSAPRDQLSALRSQLVDFGGDLQNISDDVSTTLTRLAEVVPRNDPRHSAVLAAQQPYVAQLNAVRDAANAALNAINLAADTLGPIAIVSSSTDGTATPTDPALPIELPGGSNLTMAAALAAISSLSAALGAPLASPTSPGGILDPDGA